MNKKIGVLLVHGMGAVPDDFAHDLVYELRERIAGRGLNRDEIAWESVHWSPLLSAQENRLWVDLAATHDLNWAKLRKFFINAFGIVSAYHSTGDRHDRVYQGVHGIVHEAIKELQAKLGGGDKPMVIVAHGLGGVIMSNYIWDRQRGRDPGRYGGSPFERMETLVGMVTLGCNIPMFTVGCDSITAIEFPPPTLSLDLKKKAKWLNIYDSDDVLGWPLKQLSPSYAAAVTEDIEVSVGNILTSWNPANHQAYWTDDSVIKPTLYLITSMLEGSAATQPKLAVDEESQSYMGYPD